jgi:hypothetical protein
MAHARRMLAPAASLVAAVLFTGCASVPGELRSALQETNAAVQSARLAVRLDVTHRATTAVVDTTLTDALQEITSAAATVSQLDPSTSAEATNRQAALRLIRQATDAVNTARGAVDADRPKHGQADLGTVGESLARALARAG